MTTAAALEALASPDASNPEWIWRSGELVPWEQAAVHVNAVGHASVAAVFEGIKAYLAADGQRLLVFRLDDHLRRLADSARLCRLSLPYSAAELHRAVVELLTVNGYRQDAYLRPWAFPGGIIREQMVPADAVCEVIVDSWPFRSALDTERGCRAAVSSWLRVGESSMPPRAKAFSNYHNGRLAMMEARENGHDWPVMLNERHKVSEGAGACLALVRDGVVATPHSAAASCRASPGTPRSSCCAVSACRSRSARWTAASCISPTRSSSWGRRGRSCPSPPSTG